jgi:hypothetical protein
MNFDPDAHRDHGGDEEIVTAAFTSYKDQAPALFTPPPVDEIVIAGPARLRRRRFINLAALVGACTVVTAGGFAVAGWPSENALIDRRAQPGPYWFVMALQTFILIGIPTLIAFAG